MSLLELKYYDGTQWQPIAPSKEAFDAYLDLTTQ